ncbi:hypothetical protein ACWDSJ_27980 [Nocardia sp. NPDC003482]
MSTLLMASDWLAQVQVPNPPAKPLPGTIGDRLNDVLGYGKTVLFFLAVAGMFAVAGMLIIGLRGRSDTAKNALTHLPYVICGVMLTGGSAGLIQVFQ